MSNHQNYNLNEQIYENSDKTIKIFKTRKYASIKYIAVKVYNKKYLRSKYSYEYDLIHSIKSEGLLDIITSSEDYNYFYMEMEYCATGDLSRCLWQNKNNLYIERSIKTIGCQLLSGLRTLHKNGIIHCNLKPSNIVIDEYGNVKICDFKKCLKISKMTNELIQKNKCAMTPCYTAPELFRKDGKYSFKSDLWALGCILFELAVGQVPFFDNSIDKLITKIIEKEVNFDRKELTYYSDDFIDVLKKLLIKEPNERTTWGEIERMPWWDGYFYSNNELNQKTESNNNLSKMNTTSNTNNNDKKIDASKLSKIAVRNKREQKQDYNYSKDDKIGSTEDEFDFQSNDIEDLDESSYKNQTTNCFTQSNFPMNVSVLNISKAFKRDRRTYDEINSELIKSSEEEIPKLCNLVLHQSDRVIKPIIGNKIIEENQALSYNRSLLPFNPWRKDNLKEMMANNSDLKNVENYLYNIYSSLEEKAKKKEYEVLINLLKYFETLVFDRDIANNLINTSFIQLFINFLTDIKNEQVQIKCCCIIGYMIRYATIISSPLDKYGFCDVICKIIKDSKDNSDLIKKATATVGEYLFYVGTQEEAPDNNEWKINKKYLEILLYCLDKNRNEVVQFYSIKTIENLCILTNVSKNYFAKSEFFDKILQIFLTSNNLELKYSAISTISHILRHNSSFIQSFFKNCEILTNRNVLLGENENIRQCLINCILFSINNEAKVVPYILSLDNKLVEILLILSEKCNNILKIKIILLIGLIMINPNIIIQYGEETFIKMKKFRNDKNREIHIAVKFFEKSFCLNSPNFIQAFISAINKNDKMTDIYKYCETFDIIGIYHKISYAFFTPQLLNTIKDFITKKINSGSKDENLIGALLDVLIKFSENPISVEQNVDVILKGLLIDILKISQKIKGDNSSKITLITANILTIILSDENLYSIDGKGGKKNNEIRNLIKKLIPIFGNLIQDNELTEEILSLLSLIVERDENYIVIYKNSGVIDYIFDIMTLKEFSYNLNILKILIILMESKNIGFQEILDMNFIDRINFLIDRTIKKFNLNNNEDEESSYLEYVFELFYDMITKIIEYKKKKYPKNKKIDINLYKKDYSSKLENIGKNFNLCIKLLGNQKNVNLQEISCVCLIFILQTFPGSKIESLNLQLKFKTNDIPNLLKGLELSCYKIHKKMIHIFQWIVQFQDDATKIIRPYLSYLITYLENICNTSTDAEVIETAQKFLDKEINQLKS